MGKLQGKFETDSVERLAWLMMLNGMTHVVISVMIIFVFVWIFGDTVPVMVSIKSSLKLSLSGQSIGSFHLMSTSLV